MNRKPLIPIVLGVVAAAIVGAFVVLGRGGSDAPVEEVLFDAPDAEAGESASRSGGPDGVAEGVGVKGHWELTVLNADDSVAAIHQVDNALHEDGELLLAEVLSGERVLSSAAQNWELTMILTQGSFSGQCPVGQASSFGECFVLPNPDDPSLYIDGATGERDVDTVVVAMETDPFAGPGTISGVASARQLCDPGISESASCAAEVVPFTGTLVDPIDIGEGQRILVTVTLSFATG